MATKCIDQIPPPRATAAIETEIFRCDNVFADRFCVKVNPVKPDTTANKRDSTTRLWLCE